MWILSFFPDFLVHMFSIVGLALFLVATFLGMFPIVNQYKTLGQIVGLILLVFGIYLEGGLAYKEKQALEVAKLEAELAEAKAKSEKTNTEIVTRVVKDTQVVKVKGDAVIRYIEKEVVKYDDKCIIPSEVIEAHNRAATLSDSPAKDEVK